MDRQVVGNRILNYDPPQVWAMSPEMHLTKTPESQEPQEPSLESLEAHQRSRGKCTVYLKTIACCSANWASPLTLMNVQMRG